MNLYALAIGLLVAICVVVRLHKRRAEKKELFFVILLATFPAYYWVFAIYSSDFEALGKEALIGSLFIGLAYFALKTHSKLSLLLLSIGYISHAIYDVVHNSLFINAGTPILWPELCGSFDVFIGLYLMYMAISINAKRQSIA